MGNLLKFQPPSGISKSKWVKGLSTLNDLWKRGLLPDDLKQHFILYWFVILEGNIIQTAKALDMHRNSLQLYFVDFGFSKKTVELRYAWKKLKVTHKGTSFEQRFYLFYKKYGSKPRFTPAENAGLVGLWQTKFPFKTLKPHYAFWAIRNGKSRKWIIKTLEFGFRHVARLLNPVADPKTRDGFWLSPLKPRREEIYSRHYQNE
jgi:hypothetical protein